MAHENYLANVQGFQLHVRAELQAPEGTIHAELDDPVTTHLEFARTGIE